MVPAWRVDGPEGAECMQPPVPAEGEFTRHATSQHADASLFNIDLTDSIRCDGDGEARYRAHYAAAVAVVLLYVMGVPLLYFVVLFRERRILFFEVAPHSANALYSEANGRWYVINPKLEQRLGFLYAAYEPDYWPVAVHGVGGARRERRERCRAWWRRAPLATRAERPTRPLSTARLTDALAPASMTPQQRQQLTQTLGSSPTREQTNWQTINNLAAGNNLGLVASEQKHIVCTCSTEQINDPRKSNMLEAVSKKNHFSFD